LRKEGKRGKKKEEGGKRKEEKFAGFNSNPC
jgi:hypothetical protein